MITDLELYPFTLVHGGTDRITNSSNRVIELSNELSTVNPTMYPQLFLDWTTVTENPSFNNISTFLESLIARGINICGRPESLDVYSAKRLLVQLNYLHQDCLDIVDYYAFNLFPRSGGLREAVIRSVQSDLEHHILEKFIGHPTNG